MVYLHDCSRNAVKAYLVVHLQRIKSFSLTTSDRIRGGRTRQINHPCDATHSQYSKNRQLTENWCRSQDGSPLDCRFRPHCLTVYCFSQKKQPHRDASKEDRDPTPVAHEDSTRSAGASTPCTICACCNKGLPTDRGEKCARGREYFHCRKSG